MGIIKKSNGSGTICPQNVESLKKVCLALCSNENFHTKFVPGFMRI
jgi:hypothetical protein